MENAKVLRGLLAGDRRALAKAITMVESDRRASSLLMSSLRPPGHASVVGVTGPPGTGKSTLVDRLIGLYRGKGLRVGVVAVDPSSPITGGALLGDRIRMAGHMGDKGVFIRSMASRGWSGGLTRAASQVVQLMDSAGYDVVLIETVGIGQSDVEIVSVAQVVVIVLMPGMGDDVQMSKAGLMEVGDIYVVNKGDLDGADQMVTNILSLVRTMKARSPQVVKLSALTGEGVETLGGALERLLTTAGEGASDRRLRAARGMIIETAKGDIMDKLLERSAGPSAELARRVVGGEMTISKAAAILVRKESTSSREGHSAGSRGQRRSRRA